MYLVIAWTDAILLVTGESFFCVFLADQLALVVFFVAEDIVVGRDRGRVWHHHLLLILTIPLIRLGSLGLPLWGFVVLPGPWHHELLLVNHSTLFKPLDLRSKCVIRLDKLNSELIKPKLLQSLGALHGPIDVVETVRCIISSRAYPYIIRLKEAYLV